MEEIKITEELVKEFVTGKGLVLTPQQLMNEFTVFSNKSNLLHEVILTETNGNLDRGLFIICFTFSES